MGGLTLAGAADAVQSNHYKNQAGTREYGRCTAWVNFNGTGTVAIRDSLNVSSITDNGTGDYTVNFAQDMIDINYSVVVMAMPDVANDNQEAQRVGRKKQMATTLTSSARVVTGVISPTAVHAADMEGIDVQIFGGDV